MESLNSLSSANVFVTLLTWRFTLLVTWAKESSTLSLAQFSNRLGMSWEVLYRPTSSSIDETSAFTSHLDMTSYYHFPDEFFCSSFMLKLPDHGWWSRLGSFTGPATVNHHVALISAHVRSILQHERGWGWLRPRLDVLLRGQEQDLWWDECPSPACSCTDSRDWSCLDSVTAPTT